MTISNQEYWKEVIATAAAVVEQAIDGLQWDNAEVDQDSIEERINDYVLHEQIDGHQWVIYNAYHLPIIQHSDNPDYAVDNFGAEFLAESLKQGGLDDLHQAIAFWCMYADVQGYINDAITEALDELEEESDDE